MAANEPSKVTGQHTAGHTVPAQAAACWDQGHPGQVGVASRAALGARTERSSQEMGQSTDQRWSGVKNGVDTGAIPGKWGSEPALQEVAEKALVQESRAELQSQPCHPITG